MKIYILADMEGISGIRKMEQVQTSGSTEYLPACKLMMEDMNAAISAAFEAGATEVVACDTHGGGGQINVDKMDPRATYEMPFPGVMMPSLDKSFSGVVLLGHHAMAGTMNAFLDHTMSSKEWFEFRINGRIVGEMAIEAAYAAHFGVPVIAVSGDEATAAEARKFFGKVECAIVKKAVGRRNSVNCLPIPEAHKRIRKAIITAIRNIKQYRPWKPKLPATLELTMCRTDMVEKYLSDPRIKRIDARTLRAKITSLKDIRMF